MPPRVKRAQMQELTPEEVGAVLDRSRDAQHGTRAAAAARAGRQAAASAPGTRPEAPRSTTAGTRAARAAGRRRARERRVAAFDGSRRGHARGRRRHRARQQRPRQSDTRQSAGLDDLWSEGFRQFALSRSGARTRREWPGSGRWRDRGQGGGGIPRAGVRRRAAPAQRWQGTALRRAAWQRIALRDDDAHDSRRDSRRASGHGAGETKGTERTAWAERTASAEGRPGIRIEPGRTARARIAIAGAATVADRRQIANRHPRTGAPVTIPPIDDDFGNK